MDAWEIKARELFPDLYAWLPGRYSSIYSVLGELLDCCIEAHQSGDTEHLRKIYDFAEWCVDQEDYEVFNAAVVSFYEHLVDDPITYLAIPEWIRPDIFYGLSQVLEWRLGESNYKILKQEYEQENHS